MTKKLTGFILAFAAAASIVFSSFPAAFGYCGTGSSSDPVLKVYAEDEEVSEQPAEESDEAGAEEHEKTGVEEADEAGAEETDETVSGPAPDETVTAAEAELPEEAENGIENELPEHDIPVVVIYIDESEGHTIDDMNSSRDHSVQCSGSMEIIVPEGFAYCDMDTAPSSLGPVAIEYIRGRGNSTWRAEKKPYKIKLSKKTALLGMARNKHWVLLANVFDPTSFKNRLTGYLGDKLQLDYTPNGVPVDVVMVARKDGIEYARTDLGSYLLAEQVRVDENRVDIRKLGADDTDPEDITGGYLVQFGSQVDDSDPDSFLTEHGIDLANDTPTFDPEDSDYTNETQKEYIRSYIQSMEDALFGKGVTEGDPYTNSDGIRYNEYMDMESAAKYWLIQEVSNNSDMYLTGSNYFYKTEDQYDASGNLTAAGRLYWGPLWDFDQGWSVPGLPEVDYKEFHLKNEWLLSMVYDDSPDGFRETAKRLWPKVRDEILHAIEDGGLIDQYCQETEASFRHDYDIWKDKITEYHVNGDLFQNKEDVKTYLRLRIAWMDEHILNEGDEEYPCIDDAARRVTYIADGQVIRREYYKKNGFCEMFVPGASNENVYIPEKEGYIFTGWKAEDGTVIASSQNINEDRVFYADFVSEEDAVKAQVIRFRSEKEWCFTYSDSFKSQYTILPYDAQERSVTWTSSDPNIASVDAYGNVKIHTPGTVTVTAVLKSGASASYQLTILENPAGTTEDFEISEDHLELRPGEHSFIDYRIMPEGSNAETVYFRSDNPDTARVDENGVVTAVRPGTATITAGIIYYDEEYMEQTIEKTCLVTVTESETAVLTYKLIGGTYNGSTADIEEAHTVGDVIKVHDAPERNGYIFLYWQGSQYNPGDSYTVSGDHTFTAVWKAAEDDSRDNSSSKDTSRRSIPETGDWSDSFLWLVSLAAACTAAVWTSLLRRKPEDKA